MPDPFRHYEGVPLIDLPADEGFLPALFYHSCAISASKVTPSGDRYALRVNPSSGNLHPTEFHFATRGLPGWEDGCYHYRPSSHMVELRGRGDFLTGLSNEPLVVLLSSIVWREAWKYRERAYRYINHDIGHAWQALAYAAGSLGCATWARGLFADNDLSERFHLAEDEWPMLVVEVGQASACAGLQSRPEWFGGTPNALSPEVTSYPVIEEMHAATKLTVTPATQPAPLLDVLPCDDFGALARRRRSALDFNPEGKHMAVEQLSGLLDLAARPLAKDWSGRFITLYVFAHRVDNLAPGLYRNSDGALHLIKRGDQRVVAAALSLHQELAGNSVVTLSMIADLRRASDIYGDRAYRFVHHEAGAIGQRLYLGAEALGFQATGIGAFYDDHVHHWLDLTEDAGQVVYHFAIGEAVPDPRITP